MFSLTIETKPKVEHAKTRRFSADCLSYVCADYMWEGGRGADSGTKERPVFMVLAGRETTLRPFVANLRVGRRAEKGGHGTHRFEIMKSAPYLFSWQRFSGGTAAVTIYLPDLFVLDPGMIDPDWCQFVSMVPSWWAQDLMDYLPESEVQAVRDHATRLGVDRDISKEIASAAHFARLLDKRTRLPLVNSLAFSWQLYDQVLEEQKQGTRIYYEWNYGWESVGFDSEPLRFSMSQERLDGFITAEVKRFREVSNG